ncbi:metallophosphoesterase [Melittangium boletus]|uniref:metallophosphoesterase n=1 Tax=Melittangium boletus TaxID=83453 RepID=UPI003DA508DD
MVKWLHPAQLIRTGLDALVAAVFGARADHRLIEAVVRPQPLYFDYSSESEQAAGEDFWLDYVSDTGDGWNPTYAVARLLAQPSLSLEDGTGQTHALPRGRILVLGGDQVYPGASRDTYEERLVQPYEEAMARSPAPSPDLFAIPGNHDWYDGLSSFMRLFCANRWLAGRRTRQSRSYFALKLPQGWWLVGTDVQLENDIDVPQVEYFRQLATHMGPTDRVILCNAEPAWILAATSHRPRGYLENNLDYLQEKVFGRRISLFLAGDLHHYRRHEDPDGRQKITAGGGGAFMHPTHTPKADQLRDGYTLQKSFPDERTSRKLARQNLLLIRHSPLFGLLTGALYLLLALATFTELGHHGLDRVPDAIRMVAASIVHRPWSLVVGLGTLGGMIALADPTFGRHRVLAGLLHGSAHIAAAFGVAWASLYFIVSGLGICAGGPEMGVAAFLDPTEAGCAGWVPLWTKFFLGCGLTFLGGFLVGPFIMGLYLTVSVNVFGTHSNEAFISLAIADWKNFLRLRIERSGQLTVYPVGLERVPRRWRETDAGPYAPAYEPDDPQATAPVLIEPPIRVRPRG